MKILEITSDLDGGGVDRLLYDYCSRMTNDIQFDFVVTSKTEGILEKPLKELGCKIYRISQIREGLQKHNNQLKKILTDNHYDVIHDHSGYKAWCNLRVAKKCGVTARIAHSHQAFMEETTKQKIMRILSTSITKMYSTELFACGNDAAKWMWGEKAFNNGKVYIMKNAIQTERFNFSPEKRERIRSEYNITDKFVIGNVARFSYQKNHEFLIKIFAEVKKIRNDAVLMLIGRGELEDAVKKQVSELDLEESVLFMGVRNDVPDLLNAMDVFVLPSRFEGLGMVYIEAQFNGLRCLASDRVPKEANITDSMVYLPLKEEHEWASRIIENSHDRFVPNSREADEYNIEFATQKMIVKYYEMCENGND